MEELKILAELMLALGLGYFFCTLYLLSHPAPQAAQPKRLPRIAVLIAMRNEEKYIAGCLHSLETQDYPLHLFRVYVIDDRSTDQSAHVIRPIIERNEHFFLISISEDKHGLSGKMNALAQGLDHVDEELVLVTDADCVLPPTWVRRFGEYFDADTVMVGGLTLLEPPPHWSSQAHRGHFFGRVQALDWIYLQAIAAGTCNAGLPLSILGNNFAFRLHAYQHVGTFRQLGFSVTEDFALMRAFDKKGLGRIKYVLDPELTIFSHPVASLADFYRQRKRWVIGGRGVRLWGYFLVGLSFFAHLSIFLTVILMQWKIAAALGIGLVIGSDYYIINRILRQQKLTALKKYFPAFELFYSAYLIIFGFTFPFLRHVKWKERTY